MSYRPADDSGRLHLALSNGNGADVEIDSPSEASFLLKLFREEDEVYFDTVNEIIFIGITPGEEPEEEGESDDKGEEG